MNYKVLFTPAAERQLKRLAKKYRRIKQDLAPLEVLLPGNPRAGDAIPGFADTVFKIRVASSDMKKGKRGGFRVIYHLDEFAQTVWLLDIYAKAEQENPDYARLQAALTELQSPAPESPPTPEPESPPQQNTSDNPQSPSSNS